VGRVTGTLRRSARAGRGGSLRATGALLVIVGAVLAAILAIAGNVVASNLPAWLSQWALPVFLVGSLLRWSSA
jgi:hypothetical protein